MVFEDLGEQLVKNIAHPILAFRLRIGGGAFQEEIPSAEETPAPSAPAEVSELSADNEVALELALWDSVKDGSPAELESSRFFITMHQTAVALDIGGKDRRKTSLDRRSLHC